MYDTTIATKLMDQLQKFLGRISPHFHKPVARFIGDMMYGIMKEKDVKLSSIVRALKEDTTPKKVEDRLSRMLSAKGLEAGLHGVIAAEGARRVHRDTLIILDPSDVQKPYAKKMEHLAKVWDGSKGDVGDNLGFWGCMAVACESGGRRPVPLHFRLWSADSPGFVSENDEVEGVVKAISRHTKKRGIYVYDRGGDDIGFYRFLLSEGLDFIVRLKERHVRSWKRTAMCGELAWQCRMLYREVVKFDHHGEEKRVTVEFGVAPVRLPDIPDRLLHMVVVRGFGKKPMMLLTTLAQNTSRDTLMKSCPIAVTPRLPSHPIAIPSIPPPPNSFETSEKSTAQVASSDAAAAPGNHGFTGEEKSHRPTQPDTFSSARFASARDETARSGRAMSGTSVLFPVASLPKMCVSAPHAGFARPVKIPSPARRYSLTGDPLKIGVSVQVRFMSTHGGALYHHP